MPGGNIRLVLPSLASKSDTSAAAQDKEQAFEKFLTDLYEGKPAIADDRQQFLKLLAKFEAFITTTKLLTAEDVVEDGGANHNRSFITYEMALGRFKTKIDANNHHAMASKDKFEKIAFLMMHDDTIANDFKKQILMDLYSPLYHCAEGAEGELQSKYILLNAASLQQRLALFAKAIAEDVWLRQIGDETRSIHARNQYIWYAHEAGLKVMGPLERDPYSAGVTRDSALALLLPAIDKQYRLENFINNVVSDVCLSFADMDLKFDTTDEFKQKILSRLKFINFQEQDLSKLFKSSLEMPYNKALKLVEDTVSTDISDFKVHKLSPTAKIDIQELSRDTTTFNIIIQNESISFVIFDGSTNVSYEMARKATNPELYDALLAFAEAGPTGIFDLSGILNEHARPEINTQFLHYQILKAMGQDGLLCKLRQERSFSSVLGKQLYTIPLQAMTEPFGKNREYSMLLCPMDGKPEVYFEKNGEYLDIAQAIQIPNFMQELNRLMLSMDAERFVSFISGVAFNLDIKILIDNQDKMTELEQYLTTCSPEVLAALFKSETIINIVAQNSPQTQFLQDKHKEFAQTLKPDEFNSYFVPRNIAGAEIINDWLMQRLMETVRPNINPAETEKFINALKSQSTNFSSWLGKIEVVDMTTRYLNNMSSPMLNAFLALEPCKRIMVDSAHPLHSLLREEFKTIFPALTTKEAMLFFKSETDNDDKEYNDNLFDRVIDKLKNHNETTERIEVFHTLLRNHPAIFERNLYTVKIFQDIEQILNDIASSQEDLLRFFKVQECKKMLVAEGPNLFKEKFELLLHTMHQDEANEFFMPGTSETVKTHNNLVMHHILRYRGKYRLPVRLLITTLSQQSAALGAWLDTPEHISDLEALLRRLPDRDFMRFAQVDVVKQHMLDNPEGLIKENLWIVINRGITLTQFSALFFPKPYTPKSEVYNNELIISLLTTSHNEVYPKAALRYLIQNHNEMLVDWLKHNHKENNFDPVFLKIAKNLNFAVDLLTSKHGKEALADAYRENDANKPINKFLQLNIGQFKAFADWSKLMFSIEDPGDFANSHMYAEEHNDRIMKMMLQNLEKFKYSELKKLVQFMLSKPERFQVILNTEPELYQKLEKRLIVDKAKYSSRRSFSNLLAAAAAATTVNPRVGEIDKMLPEIKNLKPASLTASAAVVIAPPATPLSAYDAFKILLAAHDDAKDLPGLLGVFAKAVMAEFKMRNDDPKASALRAVTNHLINTKLELLKTLVARTNDISFRDLLGVIDVDGKVLAIVEPVAKVAPVVPDVPPKQLLVPPVLKLGEVDIVPPPPLRKNAPIPPPPPPRLNAATVQRMEALQDLNKNAIPADMLTASAQKPAITPQAATERNDSLSVKERMNAFQQKNQNADDGGGSSTKPSVKRGGGDNFG